jgi:hypothetical protein
MGANAGTNAAYAQPANGMFGGFGQQQYPQQPQYQPQYQQYPAQQAYQQQQFSPYMGQYSPYMGQYGQQQYQPQAYNQQSMMGYGPANPFMTGLGMSAYSQGYPMSYMGGLGAMQNPFMGMMGGYGMGGYGGGYGMGGYGMPMGGYGMGGGGGGYGPPTNNDPMHLIDIPGFGARNSLDYGMVAPPSSTPTPAPAPAPAPKPMPAPAPTPTPTPSPPAPTPAPVDSTSSLLNKIYQTDFGRSYNPATDAYWANQISSNPSLATDPVKLASTIAGGATGADAQAYQKATTLIPVTPAANVPSPDLPSNITPGFASLLNSVRSDPREESALQGAAAAGIPGFTVYKRGGAV